MHDPENPSGRRHLDLVREPLLDASDVATMLKVKRSTVFELPTPPATEKRPSGSPRRMLTVLLEATMASVVPSWFKSRKIA